MHQFHNTSRNSRIKQYWNVDDNYYLKEDGADLRHFSASGQTEPSAYQRIVETTRLVFPLFADFMSRSGGYFDSASIKRTGTGLSHFRLIRLPTAC